MVSLCVQDMQTNIWQEQFEESWKAGEKKKYCLAIKCRIQVSLTIPTSLLPPFELLSQPLQSVEDERITSLSQCKTHPQTHFLLSLARHQCTVTLPRIQPQSAIQPIPPFQQGTAVFKYARGSKLVKKTQLAYINMSPAWFFCAEENSRGTDFLQVTTNCRVTASFLFAIWFIV